MSELSPHKIFWHSRRGMLELDLLLVPFAREVFATLPHQEQLLYQEFLAEEDQDLFSYLLERVEPGNPAFKPLIAKILAHNESRN
jgi:antitoxin CptB